MTIMQKEQISSLFQNFLQSYDPNTKDSLWRENSVRFRNFWNKKVLAHGEEDLNDSEIDEIVRILDKNGKGNTKGSEAVARAMVAQGAWRRMFNQLKNEKELSETLNGIFVEDDINRKADYINRLYRLNEKNKNNLTGQSGNAIGAMLAAWDPVHNLSVISLNDRHKICEYFEIDPGVDFEKDPIGPKVVSSNINILEDFKFLGQNISARTLSVFLYSSGVKELWKADNAAEDDSRPWIEIGSEQLALGKETADPSLFYMESQLEDFLIENWDKTELGGRYDLIEEDGELVSQQYKTGIGRIDILVQDKKTKQYVVIELKKNQTSDDTVGQLARYMGWLEENKTKGKPTKGIIIAAQYDDRLYYALRKMKDTEIYLYQVDFKLREFRKRV